jgi:kinesin family protein 4/21/27
MKKEPCRWEITQQISIAYSLRVREEFFYLFTISYLLQRERDRLLAEIENLSASSDGQKLQDIHAQKLKTLEAQVIILYTNSCNFLSEEDCHNNSKSLNNLHNLCCQIMDLKKKQENQVQLLKQKQKSDEAAKRLQDEIQYIKAQKVNYLATSCIF